MRHRVEHHGADYIPEEERHSNPRNQARVFIGAQMCFNLVILGWLPVSFGLGWWGALSAITVGLLLGVALYAPCALFGPRTGTNSVVSSGAHFGIMGRLIGTYLLLFIGLGFYALVIWAGGDALVGGLERFSVIHAYDRTRAVVYAVLGVASLVIAIFGHDIVVVAQKVVVTVIGSLFLLGVVALAPKFNPAYVSDPYVLNSFWPTWLLAVVTAMAVPISYGPFANDYSRYISLQQHSNRSIALANGGGLLLGCWTVMVFGAYTGTMFSTKLGSPVLGILRIAPLWYVVPVMVIGLLGPLSHGALCIYAPGIDIASVLPRIGRATTTAVIGILGIALVFLGAFVWNAVDVFTAFVLLLTIGTTPWLVINLIGYRKRKGWYSPRDLQVLNRGGRGGIYWFSGGWNARAIGAWAPAVIVGVLLSHTAVFTGPWAEIAGGVDLSVPAAGLIGAFIYDIALRLFPEGSAVADGRMALHAPASVTEEGA
ncbi:purine-cytosine permease family protein [Streptomyces spiralis]